MSLVKSTDLSNSNGDTQFMSEFFADVEIVKNQMAVISASTLHITDINQRVVLATTAAREQELSDELKPVLNDANKKAQVAKQILQLRSG